MPNYGAVQAGGVPTAVGPGEDYFLFNAESPTAPQASVSFARADQGSGDNGMTFWLHFASAPTATLAIQGANVDVDADYQTLFTSTNTQNDNYTDTVRWAFYRAKLLTQSAGGAVTVKVQR